jgi:aminopeptidase N
MIRRTAETPKARSRILLPALVASIALVAAGVAPAAAATMDDPAKPPVSYQPGAPGIGDSYFPLDGNGGYDVAHYGLDLSYEPATDALAGTATITATSTENLSSFNLDLDGLAVQSITVDGVAASWTTATTEISILTGQPVVPGSGDALASPARTEVTVVPPVGIDAGAEFTTVVAYGGVPVTINDVYGPASGVIHTDDGMLIVGQPRAAATWFPANDHPADKARFDFRISVPEGLQAVANGALVAETVSAGRSVWEWTADAPMAPYLATASVGRFTIDSAEADGVTYLSAIDPDLFAIPLLEPNPTGLTFGQVARDDFASQPEVVAFLSDAFGAYPFDQAGGITDDTLDLEFALENQTRPIYPLWAFADPADPSVVVHELAHQWYGDSVAIERWSDIWLNEGFATYAEWLWTEHAGGLTPQQQFDIYNSLPADTGLWGIEIADPGPTNIFNGAIYVRGAMTLHALRTEVGDEAFFEILRGWASENAGGNVSTAEFTAYAEQFSGQELDPLFAAWIYTGDKPVAIPIMEPDAVSAPASEPAPVQAPAPVTVPGG